MDSAEAERQGRQEYDTTSGADRPATDRQLDYIESLLDSAGITLNDATRSALGRSVSMDRLLSIDEASDLIDYLREHPGDHQKAATHRRHAANRGRIARPGGKQPRMTADWPALLPTWRGGGWRTAPAESTAATCANGSRGSLVVHPHAGTWHDFEADAGGGTLALVEHVLQTDRAGALRWLVDAGLIGPPSGPNAHPGAPPRRPGGTSPPHPRLPIRPWHVAAARHRPRPARRGALVAAEHLGLPT